jgi:lipoate synthase
MDPLPELSPEALLEALRGRFEELCQGIAAAVNQAPTGQVINHSEEKVRDLFADSRRRAWQTALRLKVDAAEAAFSPSAGPGRPAPEEQGA